MGGVEQLALPLVAQPIDLLAQAEAQAEGRGHTATPGRQAARDPAIALVERRRSPA